jgi:hypothetical protein
LFDGSGIGKAHKPIRSALFQNTKEIENENQNVYGRFRSAFLNGYAYERDDQFPGCRTIRSAPDQTYSASACVPNSFNASKGFAVDNFGGITNTDLTAPLTVVCPMLNSFYLGTFHSGRSGSVRVIDRNPTADVACSVIQVNSIGLPSDSVSFHSSGSSGFLTKIQDLFWSKAFPEDPDSSHVLNCTIPPAVNNGLIERSGIVSYTLFNRQ